MATESRSTEITTGPDGPKLTPQEEAFAALEGVDFRWTSMGLMWRFGGTRGDAAKLNERFNMLIPATQVTQVSPHFRPVPQAVRLISGLHSYEERNAPKVGGKYQHALNKAGLELVGGAAGIQWLPPIKKREREDGRLVTIDITALAERVGPDGRLETHSMSKEVDIDWRERKARREREKTLRKIAGSEEGGWARAIIEDPERLEDELVKTVDDVMEHLAANTETKAMNRVIRHWLAIPSTLPLKAFEKPFLVLRWVFTPDHSDPNIVQLLDLQFGRGRSELYGSPTPTTVGSLAPAPTTADAEVHAIDDDTIDGVAADMESGLLAQLSSGTPETVGPASPPMPEANPLFPEGGPYDGTMQSIVEDEHGRRWIAHSAATVKDPAIRQLFLDWLSWAEGRDVGIEDCAAIAARDQAEEDIPL